MDTRLDAYYTHARALIFQHGWMVQGVFSPDEPEGFMFTCGLTETGSPELIFYDVPSDTNAIAVAQATLNTLARRSLAESLVPDRMYPGITAECPIRVTQVIEDPQRPLGACRHFYGPRGFHLLRVEPVVEETHP